MSMSQEEIEALMSGIDIEGDSSDDEASQEEVVETSDTSVNTKEIEELISQSQDIEVEDSSDIVDKLDDIASAQSESVSSEDIDELLKDIEENPTTNNSSEEIKSDIKVDCSISTEDEISNRINSGVFPLPADEDSKVVSQLSQVANDSEEKGSQIFDVLSLSLDNNGKLRNSVKDIESFLNEQKELLASLNKKFPNIDIFEQHLLNSTKVLEKLDNIKNDLNDEDSQIFQAMELMQFNDINRQKIERVMAVIKKLTLYLNNLFEDDGSSDDIVVAKHIHGDSSNDLIGEDLDKLIEEFSNKE